MTRTRLFVLAGALVALGATTLICLPPSKKLMLAAQTQPVTNRAASSRAKLVRPRAAGAAGDSAPRCPPGREHGLARSNLSLPQLVYDRGGAGSGRAAGEPRADRNVFEAG